jgi:hypothetical protein
MDSPPYEWREPDQAKRKSSIDEADPLTWINSSRAQFVNLIIAVCADAARKRSWGIVEELIPALTAILNKAQSAALLRAFERELDQGQIKTLLKQVQRMGGSDLLRAWIDERLQPAPPDKLSH